MCKLSNIIPNHPFRNGGESQANDMAQLLFGQTLSLASFGPIRPFVDISFKPRDKIVVDLDACAVNVDCITIYSVGFSPGYCAGKYC